MLRDPTLTDFTAAGYSTGEILSATERGTVLRAVADRLEREVALTVFPSAGFIDDALQERFHRRCLLIARIDHPNVPALFDWGLYRGELFAVSRLVEGQVLNRLLARGPLSLDRTLDLFTQLGRALGAAHNVGVAHGGLRPGSVVIDGTGHPWLVDLAVPPPMRRAAAHRSGLAGFGRGRAHNTAAEHDAREDAERLAADVPSFARLLRGTLLGDLTAPGPLRAADARDAAVASEVERLLSAAEAGTNAAPQGASALMTLLRQACVAIPPRQRRSEQPIFVTDTPAKVSGTRASRTRRPAPPTAKAPPRAPSEITPQQVIGGASSAVVAGFTAANVSQRDGKPTASRRPGPPPSKSR